MKHNYTDLQFSKMLCPRCRCDGLHHYSTSVHDREEDDPVTIVTTVQRASLIQSHVTSNPSPRRTGVTIDFYCESCGNGIEFVLIQHKGSTYTAWSVTQKDDVHPYYADDEECVPGN